MAAKRSTKKSAPKRAPARTARPARAPKRRVAEVRRRAPAMSPRKKEPMRADEILKGAKQPKFEARRDRPLPMEENAAAMLKKLRDQHAEYNPATVAKQGFDESNFDQFFLPEILDLVQQDAEIFNDRIARWRCQCCDVVIPVPRRTTVFHGDYILEHDDILGLLVNGERWVPTAESPIEVQQPGRLRDPWSGQLIKAGKHAV